MQAKPKPWSPCPSCIHNDAVLVRSQRAVLNLSSECKGMREVYKQGTIRQTDQHLARVTSQADSITHITLFHSASHPKFKAPKRLTDYYTLSAMASILFL
jgi:hypothetical protein